MNWTNELPKSDGYYWFRERVGPNYENRTVKCHVVRFSAEKKSMWISLGWECEIQMDDSGKTGGMMGGGGEFWNTPIDSPDSTPIAGFEKFMT